MATFAPVMKFPEAHRLLCAVVLLVLPRGTDVAAQAPNDRQPRQLAEDCRIAEQILLYQRDTGGWPKNFDMARPLSEDERATILHDKPRTDDSTIDNGATTGEIRFLARVYQQTHDPRYLEAVRRGLYYLLSGQYAHGGWPQFWPEKKGYHAQVTFNDDAMVNTLRLLRDVHRRQPPFQGDIAGRKLRRRSAKAFDKGIECILNTQIVCDGQLTVWCQQHDSITLQPVGARSFELPSYCSQESAAIVQLLMELPHPNRRVKRAVTGAMLWLDEHKLTGCRVEHTGQPGTDQQDTRLVEDPSAPPLWARFYDLEQAQPFFCDRDGIPRRRLEQIGHERRNGYAWYGTRPARLYPLFQEWAKKHRVGLHL